MPEDTSFEQLELVLVPMRLPPAQAEHQLAGVKAEIERGDANADICFGFGFVSAAVRLATQSPHRERLLQWALEASISRDPVPLRPRTPSRHHGEERGPAGHRAFTHHTVPPA